jgi:hypothetical protein
MSTSNVRATVRFLGWSVALLGAASFHGCSCNSSSSSTSDSGAPEGGSGGLSTDNLIQNPGAEDSMGSTDGSLVTTPIPDWTTTGEGNVIQYGASGGFPATTDPGPTDRGNNFFGGGPNDAISTFTQTIDLTTYSADIAKGGVTFSLSAYLGGYSDQTDDAAVTIYFLDSTSLDVLGAAADGGDEAGDDGGDASVVLPAGVLGTATVGPVTAAQRMDDTGLLPVSTTGAVPVGTMAVEVQMVMTRYDGSNNDGYADDLSLTLSN